jgi:large subunit ribosomal protein L18
MGIKNRRVARYRRHTRVRNKVQGTSSKPRLCVFRSLNHIYVQVVDDSLGNTLAAASTLDPEIRSQANSKTKTGKSGLVGELIAKRAISKKINEVCFDRGGYKYHGRIKALGDAARKQGLKF